MNGRRCVHLVLKSIQGIHFSTTYTIDHKCNHAEINSCDSFVFSKQKKSEGDTLPYQWEEKMAFTSNQHKNKCLPQNDEIYLHP